MYIPFQSSKKCTYSTWHANVQDLWKAFVGCFHICISLHRLGKAAILVVRNSLSLPKVRATQNRMWEVRSSTHLCRPAARRPRTAERVNVYSSLSQSETLEGNVILSQQSELSYNAAFWLHIHFYFTWDWIF